jgi:dTDP-3-amino-3,4,6-trideoxy-alpha-D-glucose transaminase
VTLEDGIELPLPRILDLLDLLVAGRLIPLDPGSLACGSRRHTPPVRHLSDTGTPFLQVAPHVPRSVGMAAVAMMPPVTAPEVGLARMDYADPALFEELMDAVRRIAKQGAFTLGEEVEAFEHEFATFCGARDAVGLSSGTDALVLGLEALGVTTGSEVILPTNSFIATAEAVSVLGAMPRLIDVDERTQNITAEGVERSLSPRTACIVPVHLYGRTVDMEPILEVARAAGVPVLEDACQAHGARYLDGRAGAIGDAGCFSFYPGKNLGGWGDGGALVTSNPEIADRVRLLRAHGERPRYHHLVRGTTARLDAIQAAVLRIKLTRLEWWNEERRALARALRTALTGTSVATPLPVGPGEDHVYHQFVVRCSERDRLRAHLADHGIASGVHYPVPIHRTPAYADLGLGAGSLPVAEQLAGEICSLPLYPGMTGEAVERVSRAVHAFSAGTQQREAA